MSAWRWGLALTLAGCGARPWMGDESERIDQVMERTRFCEELSESEGIWLEGAPPLSKEPFTYSLEAPQARKDRTRRLSRSGRAPRARARRWEPTQGADEGS